MPSRILLEGILTSQRVNTLSESAELFYRRLMSVADDYGRYFAHPSLLKAHLYPLRLDRVREADIDRSLLQCERAGLIRLYQVSGAGYLQILDFRQQIRGKSKFPEEVVQAELLSNCLADCTATDVQTVSMARSAPNTTTDKDRGMQGEKEGRPTLEEVKGFCSESQIGPSDAEWFFHKCEGNGWTNGGKPIKRWTSTLIAWRKAGYLPSQKQPARKPDRCF